MRHIVAKKRWGAFRGSLVQASGLDSSIRFVDPKKFRPPSHVRIPFSVPTLERGLRSLAAQGLIERTRIVSNPVTRKRFARPRNLYFNRFSEEDRSASRGSST